MKKIHPDVILGQLKQGRESPRLLRNFEVIHEICRELSETSGAKTYTPAAMGRISEARGGPSLNTLYSPKGKHFRELMTAWDEWSAEKPKESSEKTESPLGRDNDVLEKIDDIVLRSYVGIVMADRRRLRGEVRALRSLSTGVPVIDVRPRLVEVGAKFLETRSELTDDEKEALLSISTGSWLATKNLKEGLRGEVLTDDGKIIFPRGTLPAIRKLFTDQAGD